MGPKVQSPALPIILGTDPMVGRFIACLNADHQTKTTGTHQVALTWSANAARAHVRLFAGAGVHQDTSSYCGNFYSHMATLPALPPLLYPSNYRLEHLQHPAGHALFLQSREASLPLRRIA